MLLRSRALRLASTKPAGHPLRVAILEVVSMRVPMDYQSYVEKKKKKKGEKPLSKKDWENKVRGKDKGSKSKGEAKRFLSDMMDDKTPFSQLDGVDKKQIEEAIGQAFGDKVPSKVQKWLEK